LDRAARVAEEILEAYGEQIAAVALVPSHGGRFVVSAGGEEIFNKTKKGQFPSKGEIETLVARWVRR